MVHLVAELFDNATAFSPPNSTVIVEARRLGDGALLSVEDRGIGISRDQLNDLNERLANPPMVDVAVSRMMGLVVVARLANRHAVKVELRPADTERGTIAEVGLPSSVLMGGSGVPAVAGGRGQLGPGFDGGPQGGPQRGGFPEPLALESGRGGYPGSRPFDPNPPMPNGGMLGTGGRSVPAWSDLTGAPSNGFANGSSNGFANGSTNGGGMNGFYGPRSNEVIPPLPSGPSGQPQGFAGPDGLPQRRNGGEPVRTDGDSGGYGATIPRQLPSNPETQGRGPALPPISSPPVPPISAPPVPSGPPFGGRPVSSPPEQQPPFQQQAPYQPPSQQAPYQQPPSQQAPYQQAPSQQAPYQQPPVQPQQAASAPPAWPPVAPERGPDAPPHVPESLAAALDMTTELPRYRPDQSTRQPQAAPIPSSAPPVSATPVSATPTSGGPQTEAQRAAAAARAAHEAAAVQAAEAQATAAAQIAAAQAAARQRENGGTQYADETMELPIFRELESAWFMTSAPPANAPAKPAAPAPDNNGLGDDTISSQRFSTAEPARSVGVPHQAGPPESRELDPATVGAAVSNGNAAPAAAASTSPWQTAADEGWQAARAAAEMPVDTTTTAGLPKRTPMAQLVPGGVDRGGNSVQRRTPEGVRGLLSAYHRGVQRGRTQEPSTNPEGTPGGQQSSQAGKEHEA
jgi:hypothetical protein